MDLHTRPDYIAPLAAADRPNDLLRVEVSVSYASGRRILREVSLTVGEGEIVGLVGLSGSGKSTLAMAVLGLVSIKGGRAEGVIDFAGQDLLKLNESAMRNLRGNQISFVPQSPLSSLNPALSIGAQFREAWRAHAAGAEWKPRVMDLLAEVNLPATEGFLSQSPRQLSVGMAQRVLIAMAVLHRPRLLVADEPTSALDVITQAEILQLFRKLNNQWGTAILYISHDLLSVANVCHRIAILHEGQVVEAGTARQVFGHPQHPHTRRLVESIPKWDTL